MLPLIRVEPPRLLPRGTAIRRSCVPGSGWVAKFQLKRGSFQVLPKAAGDLDPWRTRRSAGFQQKHADVRILAQPRREHTSRSAAANDDVIETLVSFCAHGHRGRLQGCASLGNRHGPEQSAQSRISVVEFLKAIFFDARQRQLAWTGWCSGVIVLRRRAPLASPRHAAHNVDGCLRARRNYGRSGDKGF